MTGLGDRWAYRCGLVIPFILFADILSPLQKTLLDKDVNKTIVSGDKLKNSWINPITLQYTYNKSNQTPTIQKTNSFETTFVLMLTSFDTQIILYDSEKMN